VVQLFCRDWFFDGPLVDSLLSAHVAIVQVSSIAKRGCQLGQAGPEE